MCVENFGSHHSNNTCHGSKHTWQHFWRIIEKLMCYLFCSAALVVPACSFHPDLAQSRVWLRSSIKESSFCWGNETANTHSPITSLTAAEPETRWRAIHTTRDGPPPLGAAVAVSQELLQLEIIALVLLVSSPWKQINHLIELWNMHSIRLKMT